jgi:hypothetical protein
MVMINYPEPAFKTRKEGGKDQIFDPQRKRWVVVTPEEWVRLNFVQYLINVKKYPSTLIAIEKELQLGELKKRFDILVYNKDHQPWMMIECKSMKVVLDESVLHQLLRYNISIPVPFLVVTNGSHCFAGARKGGTLQVLSELPDHL